MSSTRTMSRSLERPTTISGCSAEGKLAALVLPRDEAQRELLSARRADAGWGRGHSIGERSPGPIDARGDPSGSTGAGAPRVGAASRSAVEAVKRAEAVVRRARVNEPPKILPGDSLGTHRVLAPRGALPQPAEVLDAGDDAALRERDRRRRRDAERRRGQLPPDGRGDAAARPKAVGRTGAGDGAPPGQAAQPGDGLGRDAARHGAQRVGAPRRGPRLLARRPGRDAGLALAHAALARARARRAARLARRSTSRARRTSSPRRRSRACRPTCRSASRSRSSTSPARPRRWRASPARARPSSSSARGASPACSARPRRAAASARPAASSASSRSPRFADDLRALGLCDHVAVVGRARSRRGPRRACSPPPERPRRRPHALVRQRPRRRALRHRRHPRPGQGLLLRHEHQLHRRGARRRGHRPGRRPLHRQRLRPRPRRPHARPRPRSQPALAALLASRYG